MFSFKYRFPVFKVFVFCLVLLTLVTSCNPGENPANAPLGMDNESVIGSNESNHNGSTGDSRNLEPTKESSTISPSLTPPQVNIFTLLNGIDQGLIDVEAVNGSDFNVEMAIRNQSENTISVEIPPGLLLSDGDSATVNLILPRLLIEEIFPNSEISVSIPAYQAEYTGKSGDIPIFIESGIEITEDDFLNPNPGPLPGVSLSILEVDPRLGTIFNAAELSELPTYQAIQLALFAVASNIRGSTVGYCGTDLYYPGSIFQDNITYNTTYTYDCYTVVMQQGIIQKKPAGGGAHVDSAREILRNAALLNEELAAPFRIAFRSTNPAFSDQQVSSAIVALVDQAPIIERFGFGVTFHFLTSNAPPEDGISALPEINANGMSVSEAKTAIANWVADNGDIEFIVLIETGDPYLDLIQMVTDNWYSAGLNPEIQIFDPGRYYENYMTGQFQDVAVEDRWGVLP